MRRDIWITCLVQLWFCACHLGLLPSPRRLPHSLPPPLKTPWCWPSRTLLCCLPPALACYCPRSCHRPRTYSFWPRLTTPSHKWVIAVLHPLNTPPREYIFYVVCVCTNMLQCESNFGLNKPRSTPFTILTEHRVPDLFHTETKMVFFSIYRLILFNMFDF